MAKTCVDNFAICWGLCKHMLMLRKTIAKIVSSWFLWAFGRLSFVNSLYDHVEVHFDCVYPYRRRAAFLIVFFFFHIRSTWLDGFRRFFGDIPSFSLGTGWSGWVHRSVRTDKSSWLCVCFYICYIRELMTFMIAQCYWAAMMLNRYYTQGK